MHPTMTHSELSELRLCRDPHQEDLGAALQMSRKKCNNNQQRRGRRRAWRGPHVGQVVGIYGSISLAILVLTICMAHTSTTVTAIESSNSSASSAVVMVAVTPSIAGTGSSSGSGAVTFGSGSGSSSTTTTTETPPEQQQPQGHCLLDGLWVPETTVHCEKQTSCRAIQRTGHCCPDYKCDCEKDGKTYANGYKLVDPDTPCTVCYCKGGEIVCSSVTCFRRDDCMPKYVPGRCCPEYDNCPILDNNPPLSSEASSTTTSTQKPAAVAQPAGYNWNITIKEITKPSEIRITDDNKAKPAIPTRKSAGTVLTTEGASPSGTTASSAGSTTATPTAATTATTQTTETSTTTEATYPPTPTTVLISTDAAATPTTLAALAPLSQDTTPKALPGTSSSESLKLIASAGYIERPHAQSGNDVEQNIKNDPLVSYNPDGLLPLAQNDPSKVSFKREFTTERASPSTQGYEEPGTGEAESVFIQNGFGDALAEIPDGELEPDTAGSDNIYHIISTTEGPSSGIGASTDANSPLPGTIAVTRKNSTSGNPETEMSTEGPGSSSEMPPMSSTHHMDADEDVPQVESNPAYPSLPEDDFSLRDVNFPLVELEDVADSYAKDEPRSIPSPFEADNRHTKVMQESALDGSGSGSGSGDMEPSLEGSSTTDHVLMSVSSSKERSPMVPLLMYSAEDNSGETRIQNASDLQLENIGHGQSENETSEELEALEGMMGSGIGNSSGEIKEPTTPRSIPISALDIDELGSGAGQLQTSGGLDPKADAESLKLDESQETIAKTTSEDKSSTRAEKSFVERALPLGRLYLQRIY